MKRRVEKKFDNQFRSGWCIGCGENHGGETRLESSRRRRVEGIQRRLDRKTIKKAENSKPNLFKFTMKVDATSFMEVTNRIAKKINEFVFAILGDLKDKTFTGILNKSDLKVLGMEVYEPNIDILKTQDYEAYPLKHDRKPNSDETVCGMPWIRPHSDDRSQFNGKLCPGCFVLEASINVVKDLSVDPYVQAARFGVLDAEMLRQGYRSLPKITDPPNAG